MDPVLKGVGSLPSDSVECSFSDNSFDLRVDMTSAPGGKHYRLRLYNLDKDIIPAQSRFLVKKNRVELHLKKASSMDHWMNLVSKKARSAAEESKKGDKKAGVGNDIMDMMKTMYEDGDDQMKKVIAEAWTKSSEERKKAAFGAPPLDSDF